MLQEGQIIHDVTVLRHCGGGAYGDVYYCRDISGKVVSLKIVSKVKLGSEWKRELKGISNYRKVSEETLGLLRIYHVGEDEETFFYTMEPADAVQGQEKYTPDTLAWRLAHGALPPEQLLPVLSTILDDITVLHNAGFAHRDIKPDNVLFINGKPKLADLGLLSPLIGTITQLAGTLDFLPPELRIGNYTDNHDSRQQSDIYAFGKIIYCCVTGKNANEFPSLPKDFALSLPNKLFFRLCMRICNTEKLLRMTELQDIHSEFERIERVLKSGEGFMDKLRYGFSSAWLAAREIQLKGVAATKRHGLLALFIFALPVGAALVIYRHFRMVPDKDTNELEQAIHDHREKAKKAQFKYRDITFLDGQYSVSVPLEWETYDSEQIDAWLDSVEAAQRNGGKGDIMKVNPALSNFVFDADISAHGLNVFTVMPPQDGSDLQSFAMIRVIKQTKTELDGMTEAAQMAAFKFLVATRHDDIEAVSLRRYEDRHGRDTLLFVGQTESKAVISYIFPQEDHSITVSAVMPKAFFENDMPGFLHLMDSLAKRKNMDN